MSAANLTGKGQNLKGGAATVIHMKNGKLWEDLPNPLSNTNRDLLALLQVL